MDFQRYRKIKNRILEKKYKDVYVKDLKMYENDIENEVYDILEVARFNVVLKKLYKEYKAHETTCEDYHKMEMMQRKIKKHSDRLGWNVVIDLDADEIIKLDILGNGGDDTDLII